MIEYLIRRGQENIILSETHQEVIQIKNDLIEIRKNQKNQSNMLGLKLMKIEKLLFDIYKQIILVTFALYRYVEKRINKDEFTQYIANVKQRAEKYMKGEEK
ncbi:MAG: hypothetical protein GY757_52955 [bacterium]|nr:hypothetical protein [bacterium]